MVYQIQVTGLEKTQKLVNSLASNLKFETLNEAKNWMINLRKAMIIRVPKDTRALKSGIGQVQKGDNFVKITIQGNYLIQQEEGKGMPHYMPISLVKEKSHPRAKQARGSLPHRKGLVIARRYTPFIKPSLKASIHKLEPHLKKSTKQAIQKSR